MLSIRTRGGSFAIIIIDALFCFCSLCLFRPFLILKTDQIELSTTVLLVFSILYAIVIVISLFIVRLYSFMEYIYPIDLMRRITPGFFLSVASVSTMVFFIDSFSNLDWRLILPLVFIFTGLFIFRFYIFYIRHENRERILILGTSRQAKEIIKESQKHRFRGYEIILAVTFLKDTDEEIRGVPIKPFSNSLKDLIKINAIDTIVVTLRKQRGRLPVYDLLDCKMKNIRIKEGFTFYEKVKRKIFIDNFLKPSWFVFEEGFYHTSLHGSIKRAQGLLVSFILLTLLSPVLLLVALLIKLESSGNVFFVQERIGRNNKPFNLMKFRSMCQDAENKGAKFAEKNDPRVTRIGRIIRKIRLDEIPQFINIFKGDMDMVGPRPERPVFVKQLEKIVPYYSMRHSVRPGLTGWAQVKYPYGEDFNDSREKLKYDLYYVKHFSWYLDLLIMILTVKEVFFGEGQ